MNWTCNVRSNDGAMNGLEFARCTTADWAPPDQHVRRGA
jgi:hypothetical protein